MSVYAVSDLHGCLEQWTKIYNSLNEDDRLFVLGDCIDRQSGGLAILQQAINDPRITVLCGNHEDMMADALEEEQIYGWSDYWIFKWFQNGGRYTYDDWADAGRDFGWIEIIRSLPTSAEYINKNGDKIIMSHSGVTPKTDWPINQCSRRALIWDRSCLRELSWHRSDDEYYVFGHTPVEIMDDYCGCGPCDSAPLVFCDGHKINIDNGACWSGKVCLLNLDTFESELI